MTIKPPVNWLYLYLCISVDGFHDGLKLKIKKNIGGFKTLPAAVKIINFCSIFKANRVPIS